MLSDFLDVLLALAASPLTLWLVAVGLLIALGVTVAQARRQTLSPSRPADGEPYDWKEHGL